MRLPVLVVEDDLATRTLLRVVLNRAGFEVDVIGSASDVMTLLSEVTYSALLFDLYMHGVSGHELLALLAVTQPKMLPRVVVVSSAPKQDLERIRRLFANVRVIRKPFELEELIAAVSDAAGATATPPQRNVPVEFCRRSIISGAKAGVVLTPASDGLHFDLAFSYGYSKAMLEPFVPAVIDSPYPVCLAYRHGRAIWLASLSAASSEYPTIAPVLQANQSHALAAVPLVFDGRTVGVVGWSFREPRPFESEERRHFEDIAGLVARELTASSAKAWAS
jgi:CheY-like chemotaxis protein